MYSFRTLLRENHIINENKGRHLIFSRDCCTVFLKLKYEDLNQIVITNGCECSCLHKHPLIILISECTKYTHYKSAFFLCLYRFFSELIMNLCVYMKGSVCVLTGLETFMTREDLALSLT